MTLVGVVAGLLPLVASPASAATTTLTVTSAADAGPGSLRQLLLDSEPLADDVTITIPPGIGPITLTTGALRHGDGVGDTHRLRIEGSGQTITQTTPGARVLEIDTDGDSVVERLTITGGDAGSGACGGGIRVTGGLALLSSVVTGNSSPCGGGGIFGGGAVAIIDSVVSGNDGGVIGGGVYTPTGWVTLERSTISGNTAQLGGGILASIVTPRSSTISGNVATDQGGGIYAGTVLLEASTVSGNTAGSLGGGILAEGGSADVELHRSTVAANEAPTAANVGAGSLSWWSSIVSGPEGGGANCVISGALGAGTSNLSDDTSCGTPAGATTDPALGPLADNGGPTQTHLPAATSPAVDAIAAGLCGDPAVDQRGFVRPTGAGCDIGAVEAGAAPVARTFTGAVDHGWSHPGNWDPVGIPEPGADVVIGAGQGVVLDVAGVDVGSLSLLAGASIFVSEPAVGPLTVRGDLTGASGGVVHPQVLLPEGHHVVGAPSLVLVGGIAGPGDASITGHTTIADATSLTGGLAVERGTFLATHNLPATVGGVTLEPGSTLLTTMSSPPGPVEFADDVVVVDGDVPAVLEVNADRFTGGIELQGDLEIGLPVGSNGNAATYTGTISGPGGLLLRGSATGTFVLDAASTYGGGTTVAGRVGLGGGGPLGTGAVAVTETGRLDAVDASLPNAISYEPVSSPVQTPDPFLTVAGAVDVGGPLTIIGTHRAVIGFADGAAATIGPGLTAAQLLLQPTGGGATLGRSLAIASPATISSLAATDVSVDLAAGSTSVGHVDLVAGVDVPTFRFGSDGQHVGAASIGGSGHIDLRGTDQTTESVVVLAPGSLRLGRRELPVEPSRLTVGSVVNLQPGAVVELLLTPGGGDRILAPGVNVGGAVLDVAVHGAPAIGQVFAIIDNAGSAVQGTFAGLPEGSVVAAGDQRYRISYVGGTGNDVTLTRLPDLTSTWNFATPLDHTGGLLGAPALSSWGTGRVDGWVVGLDRAVWHRFYDTGSGGGWESLGGITRSTPAATSQVPGEVDLFVRGADDALWTRSYRGGWGPWTSLGGILTDAPSVTSPSPGNLVVAARGNDGAVWLRRMVGGSWQGWTSLGGGTPNAPSITDWGDGRVDVFIRGLDGALWQQTVAGGVPGGWVSHGGVITHAPAAASSEPNHITVFGRGGDGVVWLRAWQGAAWADWRSLGFAVADGPGAAGVAPGEVQLGLRGPDGGLRTSLGTRS